MRPRRLVPLLAALAAAAFSHAALASEFSDYRIPTHRVRSYAIALNGDLSRQTANALENATRQVDARAAIVPRVFWWHDADDREWDVSAQAFASGLWHNGRSDFYTEVPGSLPPSALSDAQRSRWTTASESWTVRAGTRIYPGSRPVGFEVRGVLAGDEGQNWYTATDVSELTFGGNVQRSEQQRHDVRWNYRETAELGAAAGWGRVRDATPVFDAMLLEERLARDHVLERPLSAHGLERLAQIFALRSSFSLVHDQPRKDFWREVEAALADEGALTPAGLDAFAALHADEPLVVTRGTFLRPAGVFVGPAIRMRHEHRVDRFDSFIGSRSFLNGAPAGEGSSSLSSRSVAFTDRTFYGARAELHRPMGRRTQFDADGSAFVDLGPDPEGLEVNDGASIGRLIGERWFAAATLRHHRVIDRSSSSADLAHWGIDAGARLAWYLEDFLSLQLEASQSREHFRSAPTFFSPGGEQDARAFRVALGFALTRGALDAPAIVSPQRPRH